MPKRKNSWGSNDVKRRRDMARKKRQEETEDERTARLQNRREMDRRRRDEETEDERTARLQYMREMDRRRRDEATPEERRQRLDNTRQATLDRRATEDVTATLKRQQLDKERSRQNKRIAYGSVKIAISTSASDIRECDLPSSIVNFKQTNIWETKHKCIHCHAFKFPSDQPGQCCNNGKVVLPPVKDPPEKLKDLLMTNRCFKNNIRAYNNSLCLASIGFDKEVIMPGFSPNVKIQGKTYHSIGSLFPNDDERKKFAQIYIHDEDMTLKEEAQIRKQIHQKHGQNLNESILLDLTEMMHQYNPFVISFQAAAELPEQVIKETKLVLRKDKKPTFEHNRRYNLPMANEVALVALNDSNNPADVVLNHRDGSVQRMSDLNRTFDPLHYVLLFPHGDEGWHVDLYQTNRDGSNGNKITPSLFYSHRLQVRDGEFNTIIRSSRLMQEYVVGQYHKAERQKLKWIANNQTKIRAEKYNGLMDAVHSSDGNENIGQRFILPPTHYGSPRWYQESFQDAMAIVRQYGRPHLFVTFTANAQWPEITESLYEGEQTTDRPDLVARVFHMKLQELLTDILKRDILGKVKGYMCVKEDQKRGLPHVHVLLILHEEDAPKNPDDYDRFVCAEIPDKDVNPQLYDLVKKFMIHGPCLGVNNDSPCIDKAKKTCDKNFPKIFHEYTAHDTNNYPSYRRRSVEHGGHTTEIWVAKVQQRITIDNRWIIPYNPVLLLKYRAHINVEIVGSVAGVKYLYKYITKGTDRIIIENPDAEMTNNEIKRFTDARYISASEALWKLYGFPVCRKYPPVDKLPVHLEDQQVVLIHEGEDPAQAANRSSKTQLTEFFTLNREDPDARQYLYPDILRYFIWDQKQKKFRPRKNKSSRITDDSEAKSETIGRIPVISINCHNKETYFLRMLLHHKTGPTSFKDLRTINGTVCETYQEACVMMGLFEDDTQTEKALEEAASIKFGRQLRQCFVIIVLYAMPANPRHLWDKFKVELCMDLMEGERLEEPTDAMVNKVLTELKFMFEQADKDMAKDFNLPEPATNDLETGDKGPREIQEELGYFHEKLAEDARSNENKLNQDQKKVYDAVKSSINNEEGGLFAIDAPGGTGKTFVLCTILAYVRGQKKIALAMATSGIAATLLPGGRTVHSKLKVPINLTETSLCSIKDNSDTAELIKKTSLMVIDEVTMGDKAIFETLDRTLRNIKQNQNRAFGGITMLFSGDWRQCLPVVPRAGKAEILFHTLKMSDLWSNVHVFQLKKNMRIVTGGEDNTEFATYLLNVGEGKEQENPSIGETMINIPERFKSKASSLAQFCGEIFDGLRIRVEQGLRNRQVDENWSDWLMSRAIISPTNDDTEEVNQILMGTLSGQEMVYRSTDKVRNEEDAHKFPTEFLNTIRLPSMPSHRLVLKPGAPIMLLRNLDAANGHVNGARYYVKAMTNKIIHAQLATGSHKGTDLLIPRILFHPQDKTIPFEMERRQFPVKPCFGITSNKSQGQTLSKVGLYLKKDFFSHGQLYVALSRVGSPRNVSIYKPKTGRKEDDYMANVVFKEILS